MSKASFSELITGSDVPVLVDFFATWCGPCQTLAPILQDVAGRLQDQVKVIKIDVDKSPAAAAQYQVQGVPTLILFHKGKVLWRQSGVVPANQLTEVIQKHLVSG
ncbi:MAG: thioredoxin [Chitinophagaceae bacterium]|nr:MAG: thioredoxin [Chitinophagaceae bacterium]